MNSTVTKIDLAAPVPAATPTPSNVHLVPAARWDFAPWNRWSFQNVRQVLPTAAIRRAQTPSPLSQSSGDLNSFVFAKADGTQCTFGHMLEETFTDGMFIWKNGRVLHESYHNGMTRHSLHLLQSMTKSVTAAAMSVLIEDGLLDPSAPISEALPELAKTGWKGATLQHVLDMTSGTRFIEDYEIADSDLARLEHASGWRPALPENVSSDWPESIWDQILSLKVTEAGHGERFKYRSIEADVLAHAMERVTGQRLPQILSERIWQPLGSAEDADITVDRSGYALACGGMSASLRDMARFGLMLLNSGKVDGRQVVPAAWCEDVRQGAHGLTCPVDPRGWPIGRFRNQHWIEEGNKGRHYCIGIFGQVVSVAPDTGMLAVKLSSWPRSLSGRLTTMTRTALAAVESAF